MQRKFCPQCGNKLEPEAVICVECGHHFLARGQLQTSAEPAEHIPEDDNDSPGFVLELLGAFVPGLFSLKVIICAFIACIIALGLLAMTLFFLMLGAIFVTLMAGAVTLIVYATAVSWVLSGEVAMLTDSLLELDSRRWLLFFALVFGPIIAICAIMSAMAPAG